MEQDMTKDEALKMCLEYIETNAQGSKFAILIKEALAQPEQEPVAIVHVRPLMGNESIPQTRIEWKNGRPVAGPLYTTPPQGIYYIPPQRTWAELTEDEILSISADCAFSHQHMDIHFARAIEVKLRSKNT